MTTWYVERCYCGWEAWKERPDNPLEAELAAVELHGDFRVHCDEAHGMSPELIQEMEKAIRRELGIGPPSVTGHTDEPPRPPGVKW